MGDDQIKVAVRVRPLLARELEAAGKTHWKVRKEDNVIYQAEESGKTMNNGGVTEFTYDYVFDEACSNRHVFTTAVHPIVESAMQGYNGTVFAYGQTSSGKTYTIMGGEEWGIIPYVITEIFSAINKTPGREYVLTMAFMEIYNEQIWDLLSDKKDLKVFEEKGQNKIQGIREEPIEKEEQILEFLESGQKKRHMAETVMNDRSSRSHTICSFNIESWETDVPEEEKSVISSQLNIVDLAGSERSSSSTGERFKEGTSINLSLSSLARVIDQLSEKKAHISFRDSLLTRILKNSLGGNAKTAVICCVSPASFPETLSTLQFASRAKKVQNKPVKNEGVKDSQLKKAYLEIRRLREEIHQLRAQKGLDELESKKQKGMEELESKNQALTESLEHYKKMILKSSDPDSTQKTPGQSAKAEKALKLRRLTWAPGLLQQRGLFATPPFEKKTVSIFDTAEEDFPKLSDSALMRELEDPEAGVDSDEDDATPASAEGSAGRKRGPTIDVAVQSPGSAFVPKKRGKRGAQGSGFSGNLSTVTESIDGSGSHAVCPEMKDAECQTVICEKAEEADSVEQQLEVALEKIAQLEIRAAEREESRPASGSSASTISDEAVVELKERIAELEEEKARATDLLQAGLSEEIKAEMIRLVTTNQLLEERARVLEEELLRAKPAQDTSLAQGDATTTAQNLIEFSAAPTPAPASQRQMWGLESTLVEPDDSRLPGANQSTATVAETAGRQGIVNKWGLESTLVEPDDSRFPGANQSVSTVVDESIGDLSLMSGRVKGRRSIVADCVSFLADQSLRGSPKLASTPKADRTPTASRRDDTDIDGTLVSAGEKERSAASGDGNLTAISASAKKRTESVHSQDKDELSQYCDQLLTQLGTEKAKTVALESELAAQKELNRKSQKDLEESFDELKAFHSIEMTTFKAEKDELAAKIAELESQAEKQSELETTMKEELQEVTRQLAKMEKALTAESDDHKKKLEQAEKDLDFAKRDAQDFKWMIEEEKKKAANRHKELVDRIAELEKDLRDKDTAGTETTEIVERLVMEKEALEKRVEDTEAAAEAARKESDEHTAKITADLRSVQTSLAEKETALAERDNTLTETQKNAADAKQAADDLRLEIQEKTKEIEQKCLDLEALRQGELNPLKEELEIAKESFSRIESEKTALSGEKSALELKLQEYEKAVDDSRQQTDVRVSQLNSDLEDAKNRLAETEEKLAEAESGRKESEEGRMAADSRLGSLEARLADAEEERGRVEGALAEAKAVVEDEGRLRAELQLKTEELEEKASLAEAAGKKGAQEVESLRTELEALQSRLAGHEEEVLGLTKEKMALAEEVESLGKAVIANREEAKAELDSVMAELAAVKGSEERLLAELQLKKEELERLQTAPVDTGEEEALKAELETLRGKLTAKEEEAKKLQRRVDSLSTTKKKLEAECDQMDDMEESYKNRISALEKEVEEKQNASVLEDVVGLLEAERQRSKLLAEQLEALQTDADSRKKELLQEGSKVATLERRLNHEQKRAKKDHGKLQQDVLAKEEVIRALKLELREVRRGDTECTEEKPLEDSPQMNMVAGLMYDQQRKKASEANERAKQAEETAAQYKAELDALKERLITAAAEKPSSMAKSSTALSSSVAGVPDKSIEAAEGSDETQPELKENMPPPTTPAPKTPKSAGRRRTSLNPAASPGNCRQQ